MDCSGFVDWVFYNVTGGSTSSRGGAACSTITVRGISGTRPPGDLVFYPGDEHVGIVGGGVRAGYSLSTARSAGPVITSLGLHLLGGPCTTSNNSLIRFASSLLFTSIGRAALVNRLQKFPLDNKLKSIKLKKNICKFD